MNIQPLLGLFSARGPITIYISIQFRRDIYLETLLRINNNRLKRKNPISNHLFVNDFICRIELLVKNRNINLIILILFCRFSISLNFIVFFCAKIEFQHKNACQIQKCIYQRKYTCNTRISMPFIVNEKEEEIEGLWNKPFSALNDINNTQYIKGSLFILFCLNDFILFFSTIQQNSFVLYIMYIEYRSSFCVYICISFKLQEIM